MKTFLTIALLCATLLSAQNVPNGSFEEWLDDEPVSWTTNNLPGVTTLSQTLPGRTGSYAIKGQAVEVNRENIGPNLIAGLDGLGIPMSQNWNKLTFYYKFDNGKNDRLIVALTIADENYASIGAGSWEGDEDVGTFTKVIVPIEYTSTGTAAFANIQFITLDEAGAGAPSTDSWFIVDDIEFELTTDVQTTPVLPEKFGLDPNYPNPFNPETTIKYQLAKSSQVRLVIYNQLGQEVATLVNELQNAGVKTVAWNGKDNFGIDVSSGVYFYRIVAGDFVASKKMMLLK
jgi:hypothetical protein